MHRIALLALLPLATAAPAHALQGGIVVGGRVGTLGIGPEVAYQLSDWIDIRGGANLLGLDLDLTGRFGLPDNRTARLALPTAFYTVGADISLLGLRVGGGLLLKTGDPTFRITLDSAATVEIGTRTYDASEVHTLTAALAWGATAPYVLIGLGSRPSPGIGLSIDLGAVLLGGANLSMTATGDAPLLASQRFLDDLEAAERKARDDAGRWLDYWPIVSFGVHIGFGGGR